MQGAQPLFQARATSQMVASRRARRKPLKRAQTTLQRLVREGAIPGALCLVLARMGGL